MSWASERENTRDEDIAYCLIGLFDVSMSLRYGEGSAAFVRLQERIIQDSDDETIFAWTGVNEGGSGLLAPSPASFNESADRAKQTPSETCPLREDQPRSEN